jgi:hypothetical protein
LAAGADVIRDQGLSAARSRVAAEPERPRHIERANAQRATVLRYCMARTLDVLNDEQ